jgi:hypothetical protein
MRESIAALLVPVLTTALLLYQVLAHLQIALLNRATLLIAGPALLLSLGLGVLAATGPWLIRVGVLAACILLLLDTALPLRTLFE